MRCINGAPHIYWSALQILEQLKTQDPNVSQDTEIDMILQARFATWKVYLNNGRHFEMTAG